MFHLWPFHLSLEIYILKQFYSCFSSVLAESGDKLREQSYILFTHFSMPFFFWGHGSHVAQAGLSQVAQAIPKDDLEHMILPSSGSTEAPSCPPYVMLGITSRAVMHTLLALC